MVQNKGIIYKSVPSDWPIERKDLTIEDRGFDLSAEPSEEGITTKNYYVSFDPYLREGMRDPEVDSFAPPFELGKPITNWAVSKVLKSNNPKFKEGDIVNGILPIEEYSVVSGDVVNDTIRKLDNPYNLDPKLFVGALGMPGLTAYSSFYAIGEPKKGETIFISAASGAVGQLVGQLAKHEGLKVIGSVGSDQKLDLIKQELKFDEGFNYKTENPTDALKRLAPNGIDIYYENVGGEQLDAAIAAMNDFGRISKSNQQPAFYTTDSPQSLPRPVTADHLDSRLRYGFPVQHLGPGKEVRREEPHLGRRQASQTARLHCLRREYGSQIRRGSSEECCQVDFRRDVQGAAKRNRRH